MLATVVGVMISTAQDARSQEPPDRRLDSAAAARIAAAAQVPQRPSVVDSSYARAESVLRAVGLRVVRQDSIVPSGTDGIVLRQSPRAGTRFTRGDVDTLTVARVVSAPRLVEVPRVLGLDVERARAEILASRLALGTVRTRPGTDGSGPVVEQHPAPGDTVRVGDAVGLLLTGAPLLAPVPPVPQPDQRDSIPPAPPVVAVTGDAVPMPAVTDSTLARALSMLNAVGLRATVVDPRAASTHAADWVVASQLPLPGEPVRPTTQVHLRAVVTSAVPKLVGLSERDAESAAAASAFGMRIERRTRVLRLFGTRVVTQYPAPLTRVAVLAPVVVTVEDPLPLVASLGAGIVLLATAAGVRAGPPRPRLRASLASDLPEVRCNEDVLVEAEVALHVELDADPSSLEYTGGSLILEEEIHA